MDLIKPGCQNVLTHNDPLPLHIYTDHGRFYSVNDLQYPGVGTVLNSSDSIEQQEFWHQWRANPANQAFADKAKNRGSLFHAVVENHFRRSNDPIANELAAAQLSKVKPFWESVQEVLPRITDIQLIESAVWHEVGCYAGTVDMVASFDGVPCILDWKTSTKPKQLEYCDRYALQLSAYCGCINRMYGTKIKYGVIVVALPLPNTPCQVFQFPLADYWPLWLDRLKAYWEKESSPLSEKALKAIRDEY